nr:MAG TPA: Protein of unknown function (DUF1043) [Caudoviricetes sp.]
MIDLILTSAGCAIGIVVGFFILWLKDELSQQRKEKAYNEALYNIVIDRQLETINELKKKIEEMEA